MSALSSRRSTVSSGRCTTAYKDGSGATIPAGTIVVLNLVLPDALVHADFEIFYLRHRERNRLQRLVLVALNLVQDLFDASGRVVARIIVEAELWGSA